MSQTQIPRNKVPSYAVFEDHRSSQHVAVIVRWFMLVAWLTLSTIAMADITLA